MNTYLLIALTFLTLPFVVNAVIQAAQRRHRLGRTGSVLALLALGGPLFALVYSAGSAAPFVIANAVIALLLGGVIFAVEFRATPRNLRYSMGLTGMLIGGMLLSFLLVTSIVANPASTNTENATVAVRGNLVLTANGQANTGNGSSSPVGNTADTAHESVSELNLSEEPTPISENTSVIEQPPRRETMPMPSPTPTRPPLQYEVPTYAQELGLEPVCDVSTETNLNIRSGPGVNHDVLTSVIASTRLNVMGTNDGRDWLEVRYQGLKGWVSADFVLGLSACINLD